MLILMNIFKPFAWGIFGNVDPAISNHPALKGHQAWTILYDTSKKIQVSIPVIQSDCAALWSH